MQVKYFNKYMEINGILPYFVFKNNYMFAFNSNFLKGI